MEIVITFIVGVVASLVAGWIKTAQGGGAITVPVFLSGAPSSPETDEDEAEKSTLRELNRVLLEARVERFAFSVIRFCFLCIALAFPAVFHQGLIYSKVDLAKLEIIGMFTEVVFDRDRVIVTAIVIAGLAYVPLLSLSDRAFALTLKQLYKYLEPSNSLFIRLRTGVFAVVCLFLCGLSTFLFTDLSFVGAMGAPLAAVAGLGLMATNESDGRKP